MAPPLSRSRPVRRPETDTSPWPATSLLGGLPREIRDEMTGLGRRETFEKGERLLREGEHGSHVHLLLSGWYKVVARTEDDREALMAVRTGGDIVGELACFDALPRVATVMAAGPGVTRLIGRQEFNDFLAAHDTVAREVMRVVAGKLRWSTRRRQEFGSCPVEMRIARVLGELMRAYGRPGPAGTVIGVSLTQPELAALVGASEPSVHRVLRTLREERVLDTGYRRILVRDAQELSRIAGTGPDAPLVT
ncbi:Crp/Fnr family transcriptional regulator [Streptomyces sp. NPDC101219]|uniref:Crp/Fnr family transcriptional regulator n=1 Tax=Streptomyces sp. NPDC101219 TaxID=3366131 RepID=UPI00380EC2DF